MAIKFAIKEFGGKKIKVANKNFSPTDVYM